MFYTVNIHVFSPHTYLLHTYLLSFIYSCISLLPLGSFSFCVMKVFQSFSISFSAALLAMNSLCFHLFHLHFWRIFFSVQNSALAAIFFQSFKDYNMYPWLPLSPGFHHLSWKWAVSITTPLKVMFFSLGQILKILFVFDF